MLLLSSINIGQIALILGVLGLFYSFIGDSTTSSIKAFLGRIGSIVTALLQGIFAGGKAVVTPNKPEVVNTTTVTNTVTTQQLVKEWSELRNAAKLANRMEAVVKLDALFPELNAEIPVQVR